MKNSNLKSKARQAPEQIPAHPPALPRRLLPSRRRRSRHALQRNRPSNDVHLRLQSDSSGMQPRRVPPPPTACADRTDGLGRTRRQRQLVEQGFVQNTDPLFSPLPPTEVLTARPTLFLRGSVLRLWLDCAGDSRLEKSSNSRHRRRSAAGSRRRTRAVP